LEIDGASSTAVADVFYGAVNSSVAKSGDTTLSSLVSKAFKDTAYTDVRIVISGKGTNAVVTVDSGNATDGATDTVETDYPDYSSK